MSIASRIEAIEGHIGDIYDTLELGGSDLTNVDKNIVNINSELIDRYKDYLANGTNELWNNWDKATETGVNEATINNTIKAKMLVAPKGDTQQTVTENSPSPDYPSEIKNVKGKNIFPGWIKGKYLNSTTGVEENSYNSAVSDYIPVDFNANPNYCLSGLTDTLSCFVVAYNSNKQSLGRTGATLATEKSITSSSFTSGTPQGTGNIAYLRATHYVTGSSTGTIDDIDGLQTQLEANSTATSFVPYNTVQIKVQNKNLAWNGWAEDFVSRINDSSKAGIETYENKNCLKYSVSTGYGNYDNKYLFKIRWKENTQYTISYYAKSTGGYLNLAIEYTDGTNTSIDGTIITNWSKVVLTSTSGKTIKYIRGRYTDGITYIDLDTFMVVEGTTAGDYVSHQEQVVNFPLSEGQVLHAGDYLTDNGIYGIKKSISFDGTEDWYLSASSATRKTYRLTVDDIIDYTNGAVVPNLISNRFLPVSYNASWVPGKISRWPDRHSLELIVSPDLDMTAFKSWLANNLTTVEYELQTPTTTAYTSEQQTAWEQIKALMSYNEQTNISQDGDLPFILDITALVELS